MNKKYRHEVKYIVPETELCMIKNQIRYICQLDKHVKENGMYHISSLYFDDYKNTAFYANQEGINPRKKYRIRIYDNNMDNAYLERKEKQGDMIHKDSCKCSKGKIQEILMQELEMWDINEDLKKDFWLEWNNNILRPKIIISYDRVPYVYPVGNVRITFDMNISASADLLNFGSDKLHVRPLMPYGKQLIEVKWDEMLPDVIYNIVSQQRMHRIAFSKYFLGRSLMAI